MQLVIRKSAGCSYIALVNETERKKESSRLTRRLNHYLRAPVTTEGTIDHACTQHATDAGQLTQSLLLYRRTAL